MEFLKKTLKILLIIIVSFAVLIYGGVFAGHKLIFPIKTSSIPTIDPVTDGRFLFGPQAHPTQPVQIDEYVFVLAEQLKQYNEVAPVLWPDNALINQSLLVEEIRKNRFWLIAPDGDLTTLSKKEVSQLDVTRLSYFDGFSLFDGGMYLAISQDDLTNYLVFQKYLHLGTYDPFITFTHEGFHAREQSKWPKLNDIPNGERNEFTDNKPARAKRYLLQKQLLKAVSEPGDTSLILDALATYADWKTEFPEDYRNSVYFDRIEGTAYYYELISCLYAAYPTQIKNRNDIDYALALLATRDDIYTKYGLTAEGYTVGGFSCVLLDRLESGWKYTLISDPEATPIELLLKHFENETLPEPQQLTQSEIEDISEEMDKPAVNRGTPLLFRFLYDNLF